MTGSIVVDIRTRFLRDDQRCYILFPGEGYRFYAAMRDEEAVFLDLPGFPMQQSDDLREVDDLVERTILSERIADWHLSGAPAEEKPARRVEDLSRYRVTPARTQFAGVVRGFFHRMVEGDIVIVPCKGAEDEVLFGEIISSKQQKFVSVRQYPDEKIPARPVRWIARMPRKSIPTWLERKIGSPNALRQIERNYFPEIFDIMYERYFFDGVFACKFSVKSREFSSLDNFLFQQIILYVAALHESREEGNIGSIAKKKLWEVVSGLEFSEDIPDQRISINSPGHIVVYSRNIIPIVAGAFMILSASVGGAGDLNGQKIIVENSSDAGHVSSQCVSDVQSEVMDDMIAMGYHRWQELCQLEVQARKRTDVTSGMTARGEDTNRNAQRKGQ